ncbi:c-type cytochrome [Tenacibaculum amylolyticum]|uniref:c-type cytochrome n=1 Tax=Tenacibaculum amylolyticum TaxID=104269 RepID=UPI0038965F98
MKKVFNQLLLFSVIAAFFSCSSDPGYIPAPDTVTFNQKLTEYNIYQGNLNDLVPTADYHLIELSSSLFVNYSEKQRLVKLPAGTQITKIDNGVPDFPEGTILVKTFFYYNDVRDPALGKKVIETRLLVKSQGLWNVATYVWNDAQTEATLNLNGVSKNVSWIDANGQSRTVRYEVPTEQNCTTCHQVNSTVEPLGPTLMNMNINVTRENAMVNQLAYFQTKGLMNDFNHSNIPVLPDYLSTSYTIAERGRAYFQMNCAHCHNPAGLPKAAGEGFDFRYTVPLSSTGIPPRKGKIRDVIGSGRMPWIGTTTLDVEGFDIVKQYLNTL